MDEILPVNIAGDAWPVWATKLSMEPRHALPRHPAFYWQNFVHPQLGWSEGSRAHALQTHVHNVLQDPDTQRVPLCVAVCRDRLGAASGLPTFS